MASQTKTTKPPTASRPAKAKKPEDHKKPSEILRAEALAEAPELAYLINPAKLKRSVRLRLMAQLAGLIGDDELEDSGDSDEADLGTKVEIDLDMKDTIVLLADALEYIDEHCVIDEHREAFDELDDTTAIQVVSTYLQLVGERFGSSN